jgi:hypothetical protein
MMQCSVLLLMERARRQALEVAGAAIGLCQWHGTAAVLQQKSTQRHPTVGVLHARLQGCAFMPCMH